MPIAHPQVVPTVAVERFMVRDEEIVYDDIVDAIQRAKKRGAGSEVYRLSDGRTVATVPGHVPSGPKD